MSGSWGESKGTPGSRESQAKIEDSVLKKKHTNPSSARPPAER